MIGYVTLGTNDMARACAFYDALLAELGAKRLMETPTFVLWSAHQDRPALSVVAPFNGESATAGNGTMVALPVGSAARVDALYAKAIALGATDEGAPGARSSNFYAAYFRDPDGNKLNFFHMG